jgi:hypothetical protein
MWKHWVIERTNECNRTVIRVVNTDTSDFDASNNEYGDFLQHYHVEVKVKKNYLEINPWHEGMLGGPYNSICARLTYVNKKPVMEVAFNSYSWHVEFYQVNHAYYILNNNKWEWYQPVKKKAPVKKGKRNNPMLNTQVF